MASRISQRAAGYRAAGKANQSCATCDCFQPDLQMCSMVAGTVSADYTCGLWVPVQREDGEEDGGDEIEDMIGMSTEFQVAKSNEAEQIVFGWFNIAKTKNGDEITDSHGHVIDAEALEFAAYNFVLSSRAAGVDHNDEKPVGLLVESMFFNDEKLEALGLEKGVLPTGWFGGFYIPDTEIFLSVVNGDRTDFSIQGKAIAEPLEGKAG